MLEHLKAKIVTDCRILHVQIIGDMNPYISRLLAETAFHGVFLKGGEEWSVTKKYITFCTNILFLNDNIVLKYDVFLKSEGNIVKIL